MLRELAVKLSLCAVVCENDPAPLVGSSVYVICANNLQLKESKSPHPHPAQMNGRSWLYYRKKGRGTLEWWLAQGWLLVCILVG